MLLVVFIIISFFIVICFDFINVYYVFFEYRVESEYLWLISFYIFEGLY